MYSSEVNDLYDQVMQQKLHVHKECIKNIMKKVKKDTYLKLMLSIPINYAIYSVLWYSNPKI